MQSRDSGRRREPEEDLFYYYCMARCPRGASFGFDYQFFSQLCLSKLMTEGMASRNNRIWATVDGFKRTIMIKLNVTLGRSW